MNYYKLFYEDGGYKNSLGEIVNLYEAESVTCPDGSPEENGWIQLPNLQSAIEFYGLELITND